MEHICFDWLLRLSNSEYFDKDFNRSNRAPLWNLFLEQPYFLGKCEPCELPKKVILHGKGGRGTKYRNCSLKKMLIRQIGFCFNIFQELNLFT